MIIVGAKQFQLPKSLLCHNSTFFNKAFNSEWIEANTQSISMDILSTPQASHPWVYTSMLQYWHGHFQTGQRQTQSVAASRDNSSLRSRLCMRLSEDHSLLQFCPLPTKLIFWVFRQHNRAIRTSSSKIAHPSAWACSCCYLLPETNPSQAVDRILHRRIHLSRPNLFKRARPNEQSTFRFEKEEAELDEFAADLLRQYGRHWQRNLRIALLMMFTRLILFWRGVYLRVVLVGKYNMEKGKAKRHFACRAEVDCIVGKLVEICIHGKQQECRWIDQTCHLPQLWCLQPIPLLCICENLKVWYWPSNIFSRCAFDAAINTDPVAVLQSEKQAKPSSPRRYCGHAAPFRAGAREMVYVGEFECPAGVSICLHGNRLSDTTRVRKGRVIKTTTEMTEVGYVMGRYDLVCDRKCVRVWG